MKSSKILYLLAGLISVIMIFSGCGESNSGENNPTPTKRPAPTPYQFNCNFDSYSVGTWTLPSGWWSDKSNAWTIVNPGSSGKGVQHIINEPTFLACPYDNTIGGNDYTITAKVRVPTPVACNAGICARYNGSTPPSGYELVVTNSVSGSASVLEIRKTSTDWSDVQLNATAISGAYLNTATYYTLTLTVSGTNPVQIVGSVTTDGVHFVNVSWTDSSSPYSSGKVGLYAYYTTGNPSPIFDDLSVTAQ